MMQMFKNDRKKILIFSLGLSFFLFLLGSCNKDDENVGTIVKERTVELDSKQEIPTVADRNEKGTANLKVFADSTLTFSITVSNLDGTDQLTVAHVHTGSPVESGSPIVTLVDNSTIKFQGNKASGKVKLNSSQFNSLKDDEGDDLYVNIHSTKLPLGLVRGQLGQTITFAQNVALTPNSNALRPETGMAILRMTKDSTLFYKVTVNNLTEGDVLSTAQINVGAAGVTGPSLLSLYTMSTDFDTEKSVKLTSSQANFLLNSEIYVSVSSTQLPDELLRGQIR